MYLSVRLFNPSVDVDGIHLLGSNGGGLSEKETVNAKGRKNNWKKLSVR